MEKVTDITTTDWNNVSEIALVYKSKIKATARPVVKSAGDAYNIFRQFYDENTMELQEQFLVLYLNRAKRALAIHRHSLGGLTGTVADPRLILATALKLAATHIILSHSHPSCNLKPSRQDELLTQKIMQAAALMDIILCDHLIITAEGYLSMAEEGII